MWRPAVAFVLVALCGTSQAFYPDWAVDQAMERAISEFELEMPAEPSMGFGMRLIEHLLPSGHHGSSHSHCMHCVHETTHHIMGAVMKHLKHMCETTSCPYLKKKCEMAKEHPGVAYGFMLDHSHAVEKSFAYCHGRGTCPRMPIGHPHCCTHDEDQPGCNGPDVDLQHEFISRMRKIDPAHPRVLNLMTTRLAANNETGNHTCAECIEGTAKCVTEAAVHVVKEWCAKTECPCLKRMCKWAEEHKEVATGILIHRVRPEEWACGYCFGKGECHCPKKLNDEKQDINLRETVRSAIDAW